MSPFDPSTGRLNSQLGKVFLWVTPPKKRESTAKWFFSRMLSNFRQLFLRKFPRYPAVNHSFLEQAALNDLFQQTSGAWISLVEPSGTITRSIFFRTAMCKQCYLKCGSRRSPRLIAINHQPEYHCFRACLKNVGDPGRWNDPPSRGLKISRVYIQSYNPGDVW